MKRTNILAILMITLILAIVFGACLTVNVIPLPPKPPSKSIGPNRSEIGSIETYTIKTYNPVKESVYYIVVLCGEEYDWTEETAVCDPKVGTTKKYEFVENGTHFIKAKAIDPKTDLESDWAPSLKVTVGKAKTIEHFPEFLRFFKLFQNIFPLLQQLFNF